MARDNKASFRFVQQASATNLFQVNNYNMGATPSTGAICYNATAATAGTYVHGFSQTINRGGFRDTNADQSILVSGETSAILNDPALFGTTNGMERYCHIVCASYGTFGTTAYEISLQGASDSGTGTAGTDWTQVSGSVVCTSVTGLNQTTTAIAAGVATFATPHGLNVGDVIIPRTAGTNFLIYQPLIVVTVTSTTVGLALTPGAPVNTTLSGGAIVMDKPSQRRVASIPLTPNLKPWVRVLVRAIPAAGQQVAANTGVFIDQAFLTMGRDTAAVS